MSNLILSLISVLLVVLLSIGAAFYGGDIWVSGKAKANAAVLSNQALQIHGAAVLYKNDHGDWPASMDVLIADERYLHTAPVPPEDSYALNAPSLDIVTNAYAQGSPTENNTGIDRFNQAVMDKGFSTNLRAKLQTQIGDDPVKWERAAVAREAQARGEVTPLDYGWDENVTSEEQSYVMLSDKLSRASCVAVNVTARQSTEIPTGPIRMAGSQCYSTDTGYTFLYIFTNPEAACGVIANGSVTCAAPSGGPDGGPGPDGGTGPEPEPEVYRVPEDQISCTVSFGSWQPHTLGLDGINRYGNFPDEWFSAWSDDYENPIEHSRFNGAYLMVGGNRYTLDDPYDWGAPYWNVSYPMPSTKLGPAPVYLYLTDGTICSAENDVTYVAGFLRVDELSPSSGSPSGGYVVTATGTLFSPDTTAEIRVWGNDSVAPIAVSYVSPTQLDLLMPPSAVLSTGEVTFTNPDGQTATSYFTYEVDYYLSISNITPNPEVFTGGSAGTIRGSGFRDGNTAVLTGVDGSGNGAYNVAVPLTVVSDTEARFVTPPSPFFNKMGWATLRIDGDYGMNAQGSLQYSVQSVTGLNPSRGARDGGYPVTVTGSLLTNTTFKVNGVAAAWTSMSSDGRTGTIIMPPLAAGTVVPSAGLDVPTVASLSGYDRSGPSFKYEQLRIDPPSRVPYGTSREACLSGAGFTSTTSLAMDGNAMPITRIPSSNTLCFTYPERPLQQADSTAELVATNGPGVVSNTAILTYYYYPSGVQGYLAVRLTEARVWEYHGHKTEAECAAWSAPSKRVWVFALNQTGGYNHTQSTPILADNPSPLDPAASAKDFCVQATRAIIPPWIAATDITVNPVGGSFLGGLYGGGHFEGDPWRVGFGHPGKSSCNLNSAPYNFNGHDIENSQSIAALRITVVASTDATTHLPQWVDTYDFSRLDETFKLEAGASSAYSNNYIAYYDATVIGSSSWSWERRFAQRLSSSIRGYRLSNGTPPFGWQAPPASPACFGSQQYTYQSIWVNAQYTYSVSNTYNNSPTYCSTSNISSEVVMEVPYEVAQYTCF